MVSETQIKTRCNGGVFKQTRNPQVQQNLGTNSCRKGHVCIRFWEKKQGQLQWAHPKQPSLGINSRIRCGLHGRTWTKNCQGPANVMKTMMRSFKKITFVADMARNMGSVLAFRV